MKRQVLIGAALALAMSSSAQTRILTDGQEEFTIPAEIYGQFAEHLGRCIYDGVWVGKDSPIPNQDGYRTDVFNALKDLQIPVLRWPGGCFAETYHWRDGIGPQKNRPTLTIDKKTHRHPHTRHDAFFLTTSLGCQSSGIFHKIIVKMRPHTTISFFYYFCNDKQHRHNLNSKT